MLGVGMTPPNVLGTPNPASSVMISSTFGACFGGTMRGAHHALDCKASFLITPPNFGAGAGNCLPLIVVADLSRLWAVAQVPEQQVSQVKVGQSVSIEVPALGGRRAGRCAATTRCSSCGR